MPRPPNGPNKALAPLWVGNIKIARSTIATALTVIQPIAVLLGFEASAVADFGRGTDQVLNGIQILGPAITGIWLWVERKAPTYRLTLLPPPGPM